MLGLLGEGVVDETIIRKMRQYEMSASVMTIYLALDSPVHYRAGEDIGSSVYVHPSPTTVDYYARLTQQVCAELLPDEPFALVCNESAADPSCVPQGCALMKLLVQPLPHQIRGDAGGSIRVSDWDEAKNPLTDRVIELLTRAYIPDLAGRILQRIVHSPVDLGHILPSAVQGTSTHAAVVPYQWDAPDSGTRAVLSTYRQPLSLWIKKPSGPRRIAGCRPQRGYGDPQCHWRNVIIGAAGATALR